DAGQIDGGDCLTSQADATRLPDSLQERAGPQNHRSASQSSTDSTGDSMSPTIFRIPSRRPKNSRGASSAGTSFATGRPRLVINTASFVFCTLSITAKHLDLNSPAAIFFMLYLLSNGHIDMTITKDC